jgi:hypothetical protein
MKDSKFIELLNLYIDHQISAADAALLEAEIQQKPERRKIYREYCQMQKACGILAENFRSEGAAGGKVVEMAPAPRRMTMATYAMGFAAAAACIALVVVKRPIAESSPIATATDSIAQAVSTSTENATVAAVAPTPDKSRPVLHPAFPGVVRDDAVVDEAVAVADHVPLDWMNQVQFQRVTADHLRFDTTPEMQTQDLTLRSTRPYQGQVETTAFIFAK